MLVETSKWRNLFFQKTNERRWRRDIFSFVEENHANASKQRWICATREYSSHCQPANPRILYSVAEPQRESTLFSYQQASLRAVSWAKSQILQMNFVCVIIFNKFSQFLYLIFYAYWSYLPSSNFLRFKKFQHEKCDKNNMCALWFCETLNRSYPSSLSLSFSYRRKTFFLIASFNTSGS